jgi:hypothetical protein
MQPTRRRGPCAIVFVRISLQAPPQSERLGARIHCNICLNGGSCSSRIRSQDEGARRLNPGWVAYGMGCFGSGAGT